MGYCIDCEKCELCCGCVVRYDTKYFPKFCPNCSEEKENIDSFLRVKKCAIGIIRRLEKENKSFSDSYKEGHIEGQRKMSENLKKYLVKTYEVYTTKKR